MSRDTLAVKAHLIRSALYLLLLLVVCVIPFALAQQNSAQLSKQSTSGNTAQFPITSSDRDRDASASPTAEFPTGGPVYDQYNNPATQPPLGIGSQKFEPAMAAFDDQAADDFVVNLLPLNFFYITEVLVMGEYSQGGGPASSFNVYLYRDAPGHLPGELIQALLNQPYTGTPLTLRST